MFLREDNLMEDFWRHESGEHVQDILQRKRQKPKRPLRYLLYLSRHEIMEPELVTAKGTDARTIV